jgi:hypothetical protein
MVMPIAPAIARGASLRLFASWPKEAWNDDPLEATTFASVASYEDERRCNQFVK